MPVFNRLHYMRSAVDSIFAQTFQDWELIVADDGSDDETKEHLRSLAAADSPRVRVLSLEHTGNISAVRNAGLREARAAYVAFLDTDDVWLPRKLQSQLDSLRSRGDRGWSYTRCIPVDSSCAPLAGKRPLRYPVSADGWILDSLLGGEDAIIQSSVVASRDLIDAAGGYPEDLPFCGDFELYARMAVRSKADFVDEPLVLLRRHSEHACDDVTALKEVQRFLVRVQRQRIAPHLDAVVRMRRAEISAWLAKSQASSGQRLGALCTLLSSAPYSWDHGNWWHGAMHATARACAPPTVLNLLRGYRDGRRPGSGRQPL
jgi:glycosyltransferase involved in cell wall biosynthesis